MLAKFRGDLKSLSSTQIFRKYILNGGCHALSDDQHYLLKERVSDYFKVQFNDVILVGSGKLGFSIKPKRRFLPFGDDSDIDVAVVSTELFQKVWKEVYLYKKSKADWPKSTHFFRYFSDGWIRPDLLPTSKYFEFTTFWWQAFTDMSVSREFGPYPIKGGLYHSQFFFEEYQKICIDQCIEEQTNGYFRIQP